MRVDRPFLMNREPQLRIRLSPRRPNLLKKLSCLKVMTQTPRPLNQSFASFVSIPER